MVAADKDSLLQGNGISIHSANQPYLEPRLLAGSPAAVQQCTVFSGMYVYKIAY